MKIYIKAVSVALLSAAVLGSCASAWGAVSRGEKPGLLEVSKGAAIDWSGNPMIYAEGDGIMARASEEPNRAKAYLRAKTYARMQAVAHLLMAIKSTRISYKATGKDFLADERLQQMIQGTIRGVQVISEKMKRIERDTYVTVRVGTRLYGPGKPGSELVRKEIQGQRQEAKRAATPSASPVAVAILREPVKPKSTVAKAGKPEKRAALSHAMVGKAPKTDVPEVDPAPSPTNPEGYTSLIVDTRGFDIARAMSPKIRRRDGSEVWGTISVDPEYAVETGVVSYERSLDAARGNQRCGDNPLIITAIGRGRSAADCDPVISNADAARILKADDGQRFLEQCKVIFVVDPKN